MSEVLPTIESEIERVLEAIVRPMVAHHAGDVEFVRFEDGIVFVKLLGTCDGCPLATLTLKAGIEDVLKEHINGITGVEAVNLEEQK